MDGMVGTSDLSAMAAVKPAPFVSIGRNGGITRLLNNEQTGTFEVGAET